jgi:glycogen debranching enzyme
LRALRRVSLIDNGNSGKVVHEVVTDGTVYFGSNADAGNTDETAKFPSAVALIWRWTGDNNFRDEMYGFTKSNMEYIFRELDEDNDGWPEGLGNVERSGMGEEKLDNTVYTIRGLYDLADMARSKGDVKTAAWALKRARTMESRFEAAWWFEQEGATQYADSLDPSPVGGPNTKIFQRHWIGVTPMEAELVNVTGNRSEPVPGLASQEHGQAALDEREEPC